MTPLISIIIPTYNQADFLKESIKSALNQTYSPIEVIVVNDGSTDRTGRVLEGLKKESRLHIINQSNQGLSAARNRGIQHAAGEYIALLDSDDLMAPERLEKQLKALKENPLVDVIYTAVTLIDEKGNILSTMRREPISPENFLALEFFRNQIPSPSTLLAKKAVFNTHAFDSTLRAGEDLEWTLRTAHQFTFLYLDLPLTFYRRHRKNLSEALDLLGVIELEILQKYGKTHILNVIDRSGVKNKLLLKGKILYLMEAYQEAIDFLNRAEGPLALFYRGNCLYALAFYKDAIQSYRQSLLQAPDNPACLNNLGMALLKTGREDEAAAYFSAALRIKPDYLDPKNKKFTKRELRKELLPYKN